MSEILISFSYNCKSDIIFAITLFDVINLLFIIKHSKPGFVESWFGLPIILRSGIVDVDDANPNLHARPGICGNIK